jgi:hypothetical protein
MLQKNEESFGMMTKYQVIFRTSVDVMVSLKTLTDCKFFNFSWNDDGRR